MELPPKFVERVLRDLGTAEGRALCGALDAPPPVSVRLNPAKTGTDRLPELFPEVLPGGPGGAGTPQAVSGASVSSGASGSAAFSGTETPPGLPQLDAEIGDHSGQAAEGIMTTDTHPKEIAVQFTAGGRTCTIGGIPQGAGTVPPQTVKGSGMIHPNLATMLVFLTTDCAVSPAMLQAALSGDVQDTFNMVSIDGDTSTNDMVAVLANGLAGNAEITAPGADFTAFCSALNSVTVWLCRQIAGDGEGATRLLECCVTGAADHRTAKTVAKSIICSSLVKAAMFGADANWGRVLCAIGYSGAPVNVHKVDVAFRSAAGTVRVCVDGAGIPFSEEEAKKVLLEKEIEILVDLKSGDEGATAWGCDLTYDYVKINGDYRT